jgi:glycosyl transferase family 25
MKFKVFLINLDKSSDRLDLCQSELQKYNIDFERVPGVYGKDLTTEEIEKVYDKNKNDKHYKKPLSLGEIGCYLSHIKCWQKIIDEQLDYAIILEDDFKLNSTFKQFESILEQMQNWDYVRVAFSSRKVPIVKRHKITKEHDLVYYKKVPINMLGQAISLEGAKKLLARSNPIFRPVDVDIKHYWESGINVIGIDPPLISERYDFTSEIDEISNGKGRMSKTAIWKNLRYILSYKIKHIFYSLVKQELKSFCK